MTERGAMARTGIGRRDFVGRAIGAAAAAAGFAAAPRRARGQGGEVVVCTWGGTYTEAQRKFFFDPFERETGIRVRTVGVPDIAKIRAMVQARAVEWDLVDAEGQMMLRLAADDMLERADFSVIPRGDLLPSAASDWGIGSVAYAYSLGWNSQKFPAGKQPRTWKDFFDTKAFPGRRAMYGQPVPVLEFALLADGVAPAALYPLDVDRAFRFLESRKDVVSVWYKSPAQIQTLFRGGEVDIVEGFSGRLIDLKKAGRRRRLDVRERGVDAVVLDRAQGRQEPGGGHAAHGPLHAARARGAVRRAVPVRDAEPPLLPEDVQGDAGAPADGPGQRRSARSRSTPPGGRRTSTPS